MLCCMHVFEDNEAVFKMIIKGRVPTMRHVSSTHRFAVDCLFDRINLDSKIQIRYIDTKDQLANTLTEGNFTRDEWNHLLHLFNSSQFSSICCAENSCYDTVKKFLEDLTEQSITTISLKSAGRRSSSKFRNGHLTIGYQLWQEEAELRTDVNIA